MISKIARAVADDVAAEHKLRNRRQYLDGMILTAFAVVWIAVLAGVALFAYWSFR